jgi:hypothetical protein
MIVLLMLAEAATLPMPAFLAGCWEQQRDQGLWTEECWTDARGGLMMGASRNGRGDKVANWEWARIERGADGTPTFHASPMGAPVVVFTASEADAKSITFVNVSHDYPQRVRYQVTETGLDAEISLADGSKPNRWTYRRTAGAAQK